MVVQPARKGGNFMTDLLDKVFYLYKLLCADFSEHQTLINYFFIYYNFLLVSYQMSVESSVVFSQYVGTYVLLYLCFHIYVNVKSWKLYTIIDMYRETEKPAFL